MRQVTLNQEIYIQFQKQYELARIEELDDQALVQVVRSPEIPVIKSKPKSKQIVILFGIVGVFCGIILNIIYHSINTIIQKHTFPLSKPTPLL